jgi:hypothetical protein
MPAILSLVGLVILSQYNNCAGDLEPSDAFRDDSNNNSSINITQTLVGRNVYVGEDIFFVVDTDRLVSELGFVWYRVDGSGQPRPILDRPNDDSDPRKLTLRNIQTADGGTYFVQITDLDNPADSVRVGPVQLVVNSWGVTPVLPGPQPSIPPVPPPPAQPPIMSPPWAMPPIQLPPGAWPWPYPSEPDENYR